jgi:DNA polymerase III delta subunit
MIYLFFGEKHFRDRSINSWKGAFKEKYNELNIFHIKNYLDYDFSFYAQNFLSNSFFSDKNLFIIDDFPFSV